MLVALVVDDSMLIRYTICSFLEQRGFTVEAATNGAEGLEIVKRLRPDLIVTDIDMPKMSGPELIAALKDKAETACIPIIIVSSHKIELEAHKHHANFAISKDINVEEQLGRALDELMGKAKATGAAAGK